jgi:hypothetical protein
LAEAEDDLMAALEAASSFAPSLRSLEIRRRTLTEGDLSAMAEQPVIARIDTLVLEVGNYPRTFPVQAMLALRERFAHLRSLVLSVQLEPLRVKLADWPAVSFQAATA